MCREAPDELLNLEHIGVTFHRNEKGELGTRAFGGASKARTYYVADITGQAIMHTLYEQLMKYADQIDRYEEWFTTELALDDEGRCVGAITRNIKDGSMELFRAKGVILASGGNGQIWQPTTNALICTGDGIAMAYRAGATLMDMEMIQYHPTTLAGKGFLITEGARGEGAHLLNAKGERFMETYAPNKMELASRDVVSRAEQTEINEGRGFPDGTVALDVTVVPRKRIHEALREIVLVGRDFAGVDITREPIHIKPGNHYTMGGVKTDVWGRTNVEGLYAAGEVACVSVHGGNRLGANSLLDTLIFGRRSGEDAARHARGRGFDSVSRSLLSDENARVQTILGPRAGLGPPGLRDQGRARQHDGRQGRRLPRRAGHRRGARDRPPPQGGGRVRLGRRPRHDLQPGRARRARAPEHAGPGRDDLHGRARAQGEPRRPVPHRLPRAQRRGVAQAHRRLAEGRRARDQLLAGDDHRLATAGEDLLVPTYTLKVRRYQPEATEDEKRGAYWDTFDVDLDETLSVLDGLLQVRDGEDGTLAVRCSCRAAICGSCGVKVNGQSALACKTQIGEAAAEANRATAPRASRSSSSRWGTCP